VLTALGIVAFVIALLVSVMLHEAGHYLTARRYGMKATQFFVGFGPTLWSRQRGETEFGIKAIPAGGFVKIVGMTSLEEIAPEDEQRAFYRQSAGRKAVVLAAGSTVHFIIAAVLIVGTTFLLGSYEEEAPVVSAPAATMATVVTAVDGKLVAGEETVPAPAQGVLQAGDRILSVAGTPTATWPQVVEQVRNRAGQPVPLLVQRAGEQLEVSVTPTAVSRPVIGADGKAVDGRNQQVGAVGVGQDVPFRRVGPVEAVGESVDTVGLMVTGTWTTVTEKLGTITGIYGPNRDAEGLVGVVGAARVSGEVLAVEQVPLVERLYGFVLLIASLNFFVGVFNLLPLLPLDGGHLAVLGYESVRDRLRRLRGYRGPIQRVDFNKLLPLTYAVVLLFLGLTLFIMGADIVNPIRL